MARRILLLTVIIIGGGVIFFFSLPVLLISKGGAERADVILHAAIDPHSKADEYVASLYRKGIAKKIVCISAQISWEVYTADYVRDHLISLGVSADDASSFHLPLLECDGLAVPMIANYVSSRGWKSALIVAHPEDSRYALWLARGAFEKSGIELNVGYAPEDKDELTRAWWRTHWKVQRFVGQAMSIFLDVFYDECR